MRLQVSKILMRAVGLAAPILFLLAAACASPPSQERSGVVLEGEWELIPLEQVDLNLLAEIPVAVSSLHRRSDAEQAVQDLYGFDGSGGVKGYIVTIRRLESPMPESSMSLMRETELFYGLVRSLPQARQYNLQTGRSYGRFTNGPPHSMGHYMTASSKSGQDVCFVAMVGMLLNDEISAELAPDAIDTQILAVLCGRRIDQGPWVAALEKSGLAVTESQMLTLRVPQ